MRLPRYVALPSTAVLLAACVELAPTSLDLSPQLSTGAAATAQIIINEVMADPSAAGDDTGEWFEVHNWGTVSANLQGWQILSGNDGPYTIGTSVVVPAGGYVVLGRDGTKRKNGNVAVTHAYGTVITLANAADWLALRDPAGTTIDSTGWSTSVPSGAARGVRDPSADNAGLTGANWSTQVSSYGKGDKGTPGARNDGYLAPVVTVTVAPPTATVAVGATQQFTASATDATGGPASSTYTWSSTDPAVATVDASGLATAVAAGSVTIRATAPNGAFGEATLTVTSGSGGGTGPALVINEVMPNPAAVTDDAGEWFEVYNWGGTSVDLQGYTIVSGNDAPHAITSSVVVAAGGHVILARNGAAATNGGVTANYAYGTALTLANSADWLVLRDGAGVTVDSVTWSSVPTGASRGVRDAAADNLDMGGTNWTTQVTGYGSGDKGTPGAQNDGYISPLPAGEPVTVIVSPSSASTTVGATQSFAATATDANGKATTSTYAWSSSNSAVATVNSSGTATAVAVGTATIRATASNGTWGEATLTVTTSSTSGSELVVHVLDIGQGDATYIANGTSKVIIDGGPDTVRFGRLLDSLGLNNTTIDVVILSHEHFDHHSGLRELFRTSRGITVRYFFENRNAYSNAALQQLRDSVLARAGRGELVYRDTDDPCANGSPLCTITMNGGAKVHVMRPNPNGSTPNNRSAPVKLVGPDSASFSMFLAGDAEHEAQEWFVNGAGYAASPGMKVNVVKANHHGSCNGVRNSFVQATNPDWVTFSLSTGNTYGHVHDQTKEMYAAYGKPWYRTDENGTITFRSPGTPGGGYSVAVQAGTANMTGAADRASTAAACNPVP